MKILLSILFTAIVFCARSQKVESIAFNLYTDSLKKGVHNYINVDGKLSNGNFLPLMTDEIILSSSAGKWDGNSLIIDSNYRKDSVVITVQLKNNPAMVKTIIIYIKKKDTNEKLKTEQEILDGMRKGQRRN